MPNRNVCHFVPDKVVSVPLGQNKTGAGIQCGWTEVGEFPSSHPLSFSEPAGLLEPLGPEAAEDT